MTKDNDEWGNIELPGLSDDELYAKNWSKSHRGDSKWSAANSQKNKDMAKDSAWANANAEKNKKLSQDPKWISANKEGKLKRKMLGQQLLANGNEIEFRRLFGIKDQHTESTKKQMSSSAKARWAKSQKPLIAEGVRYESIYTASDALGVHKDTISYRIKSRPNEYYYIT